MNLRVIKIIVISIILLSGIPVFAQVGGVMSSVRVRTDSVYSYDSYGYPMKKYWYSDGSYSESLKLESEYKTTLFDQMDASYFSGVFDEMSMSGEGYYYTVGENIMRRGAFFNGMLQGHGSVISPTTEMIGKWNQWIPDGRIIHYEYYDGLWSHAQEVYEKGNLTRRDMVAEDLQISQTDIFNKVFNAAVQIQMPEVFGDSVLGVGFFITPTGTIALPAHFRFEIEKIRIYVLTDSLYYPVQRVVTNYSFQDLLMVQIFSEKNEVYPYVNVRNVDQESKSYILTGMTTSQYAYYPQSMDNQIPLTNKADIRVENEDLRLGMLFDMKGNLIGTTDSFQLQNHVLGIFYHPLAVDIINKSSDYRIRTQPWYTDSEVLTIIKSFISTLQTKNYSQMLRLCDYSFYRYHNQFSILSQEADVTWLLKGIFSGTENDGRRRMVNLAMADFNGAKIYRNVFNQHTIVKIKIGCIYQQNNPEDCDQIVYLVFILNDENLISAIYEEIIPNI